MKSLNYKSGSKTLPVIAAVTGHCIWGLSYLFTSVAFRYAQPDIMLTIRFFIAFFVLNIMLFTGKFKISFKGKPKTLLVIFSFIEPVYFFFESYGILYTNATYSGVVLSLVPIAGMLLGALFLKEYPSLKQIFFCIIPITGAIMITLSGKELGVVSGLGIFLLVCTLFASASYRTINRKIAAFYSSFERTYCMIGASFVTYFIVFLIKYNGDFKPITDVLSHFDFIFSVTVLGVFCSVICYTIVNFAAGHMTVMTLAAFGTLTTVCSMFSGVIFLKEPLTLTSFAGSLFILAGVRLVIHASPSEQN